MVLKTSYPKSGQNSHYGYSLYLLLLMTLVQFTTTVDARGDCIFRPQNPGYIQGLGQWLRIRIVFTFLAKSDSFLLSTGISPGAKPHNLVSLLFRWGQGSGTACLVSLLTIVIFQTFKNIANGQYRQQTLPYRSTRVIAPSYLEYYSKNRGGVIKIVDLK